MLLEVATWTTLGFQGLRALEKRCRSPLADRSITGSSCFHNGKALKLEIAKWHDHLRQNIRSNDSITAKVLDVIEKNILQGDPTLRISSRQLVNNMDRLLLDARSGTDQRSHKWALCSLSRDRKLADIAPPRPDKMVQPRFRHLKRTSKDYFSCMGCCALDGLWWLHGLSWQPIPGFNFAQNSYGGKHSPLALTSHFPQDDYEILVDYGIQFSGLAYSVDHIRDPLSDRTFADGGVLKEAEFFLKEDKYTVCDAGGGTYDPVNMGLNSYQWHDGTGTISGSRFLDAKDRIFSYLGMATEQSMSKYLKMVMDVFELHDEIADFCKPCSKASDECGSSATVQLALVMDQYLSGRQNNPMTIYILADGIWDDQTHASLQQTLSDFWYSNRRRRFRNNFKIHFIQQDARGKDTKMIRHLVTKFPYVGFLHG